MKLGVAVIGAGNWGKNHATALKLMESVNLVAVCDVVQRKAETVADLCGAAPYVDACEVLKRKDVQAVTICTSWSQLGKQALQALEADKNVLVEKPMASSVEEAQKIQETAKQRGLILTIGFLTRFIPALQYVKKTETERFGGFASLRSKRTSNGQESKADSRMGVIRDLAIHDIDIARYLFNANPLAVRAEVGTMESEGIEDSVRMSLMFNREKNAYIESCWRLGPTHVRTLEVSGAKSTATLDYISQELFFGSPGISANPHFAFQLPLTLELQDFVSCVIQKRAPLVGGDDGVEALRVVEAAHESSRLGKPIDIS